MELLLGRMKDAKQIVVDVETSGLDANVNHIIGWVITVGPGPDDSFYVPVRHSGGGNMPSLVQVPSSSHNWDGSIHPMEKEIVQMLRGKPLIFHNSPFDMRFMHRVGWEPTGPIGDSMVAAYLVDEVRPSLSLDACCKDEGVQEKKGDELYQAISAKTGSPTTKAAILRQSLRVFPPVSHEPADAVFPASWGRCRELFSEVRPPNQTDGRPRCVPPSWSRCRAARSIPPWWPCSTR